MGMLSGLSLPIYPWAARRETLKLRGAVILACMGNDLIPGTQPCPAHQGLPLPLYPGILPRTSGKPAFKPQVQTGEPELREGVDPGPCPPAPHGTSDPSISLSSSPSARPLPPAFTPSPEPQVPALGQHRDSGDLGMGKRARSQKHEITKTVTRRHRETQFLSIRRKHHKVKTN